MFFQLLRRLSIKYFRTSMVNSAGAISLLGLVTTTAVAQPATGVEYETRIRVPEAIVPYGVNELVFRWIISDEADLGSGIISADDLDFLAKPKEAKAKMGFVPQDFAFYPTLNAKDNLYFFGRI